MKKIYDNSLGEEVKIDITEGQFILFVKDEDGDTAEICIPCEIAVGIASQIIHLCITQKPNDEDRIHTCASTCDCRTCITEPCKTTACKICKGEIPDTFDGCHGKSEEPKEVIPDA